MRLERAKGRLKEIYGDLGNDNKERGEKARERTRERER